MIPDISKKKLIYDFNIMKGFEESAMSLFSKICQDPQLKNEKVRNTFKIIAEDEKQHAEIVQKIINIVTNSL
jgi:rubrerythrin